MIKAGDKLHHQEKEWNVEFTGETFVHLKHGDDFIIESSHIFWNKLYAEQKQRADELEKQLNSLKEYIPSLRSAVESTLYYSHPDIELNLQSDISSYSSLMEQICKELEEDDNA